MTQAQLQTELTLDSPSPGVSTAADGRIFLVLSRIDESLGPQIVEYRDGELRPYPNETWNVWASDMDASQHFVRVNAQRIGPDGCLWIVDVGAPGLGNPIVAGGPKVVSVDLVANRVQRVYDLADGTTSKSALDDIRFHGRNAYITDAGDPAIIVLDLETGAARRVLRNHTSTTAQRPMSAEGVDLVDTDGKPVYLHADQLEVSPDGQYLYFQPACGPMYRIETKYLDNTSLSDEEIASHATPFAKTPSTGGTAIDAAGTIYLSDTDTMCLLKITPDGSITEVLHDNRLTWVDAMWIDSKGKLWLPAAQLNRMAPFQGGTSRVTNPIRVFTLQVDVLPPAIDHR